MAHRRKSLRRKNNKKRKTMKRGGSRDKKNEDPHSRRKHSRVVVKNTGVSSHDSNESHEIAALVAKIKKDTEEIFKNHINKSMRELPITIRQLDEAAIPKLPNGHFWSYDNNNIYEQVYVSDDKTKVVKIIDIGSQIPIVGIDPKKVVESLTSELMNSRCNLIGYHYDPSKLILKIVMVNCYGNFWKFY